MIQDFLPVAYTAVFKQLNVKLVTFTKGLYYCNNMGENDGRKKMGKEKGKEEEGIIIHTNCVMENN